MSRKVKILFLIGLLLIIVILIYILSIKSTNNFTKTTLVNSPTTTAITDGGENKSINIDYPINDSVYFPHYLNNYIYFVSGTDGKFYKFDLLSGENTSYDLGNNLASIQQLIWSPQSTKVLIDTYNEIKSTTKYYIFDFSKNQLRSVKQNISSGVWKDENNLIYCIQENDSSTLGSVNMTLGTVSTIPKLINSCDSLKHYSALNNSVFFLSNKSEVLSNLVEFNFNTLRENIAFQDDYLNSILSPDNQQLLIENSNNLEKNAHLLNLTTMGVSQIPQKINIDQTVWKDENNLLILTVNKNQSQNYELTINNYDIIDNKLSPVSETKTFNEEISSKLVSFSNNKFYIFLNNSVLSLSLK